MDAHDAKKNASLTAAVKCALDFVNQFDELKKMNKADKIARIADLKSALVKIDTCIEDGEKSYLASTAIYERTLDGLADMTGKLRDELKTAKEETEKQEDNT